MRDSRTPQGRHEQADRISGEVRAFRRVVRVLRWDVVDLDSGVAARMWFGALFGPVLVVAGVVLVVRGAEEGARVVVSGAVLTVVGMLDVVITRMRAARR